MQRSKLHELRDLLADARVDHDRVAKPIPAVNHPVRDPFDARRHTGEILEADGALVVVDEMQLQARRAGVDDEDVGHAGPAQPGQVQSRISGGSSPCSRP